jgi:hypothetical protein
MSTAFVAQFREAEVINRKMYSDGEWRLTGSK